MKIDISTPINVAPEKLFALVSQWELFLDKIDPDVRSITKLTEGPVGTGTKYQERLKSGLATLTMEIEFTLFDSPNRLNFQAKGLGMSGDGFIAVKGEGEESEFRIFMDIQPRGLGWLMYPMMRWDLPRRERRRVQRLKEMIESGELVAPSGE